MSRKKTVFFTVCYPKALVYLDDFFKSLVNQTDQDFDVLVINDSCGALDGQFRRYGSLRIYELSATGSFASIRQAGFEEVIRRGYQQVVFGDFDDCFSPDRIAKVKMFLKDWDIVVNDLSLFGNREEKNYLSRRIAGGTVVRLRDILRKNFMGFSNTAVRTECLKGIVLAEATALDWYLFSCLLAKGAKAIFCNDALTQYRQHAENVAFFGGNESRRREVKNVHYQFLKRDCPELALIIDGLKENADHEGDVNYPLWWED